MTWARLKLLLRSRSLRFVLDDRRPYTAGIESSFPWNGQRIWYRPGSSDTELIYKILLKRGSKGEYAIDPAIRSILGPVRTVLDIGANIGISALYLASLFPEARVFAFEPVPGNFSLLERNTRHLDRVRALPVALGDEDGTIDMLHSDADANFGGFSRFDAGSDADRKISVPIRNARRQFEELGIAGADVLKIDVEGSEWEVLNSVGPDFLANTKYIMGELHGRRDFELLGILSDRFNISVKKNMGDRCFMFQGLSRSLA